MPESDVIRLAMWSGPRNISTAMMRSFEARDDCSVIDEPFYAYYLAHASVQHPMQEEVLGSQPNEWQDVVASLLTGGTPGQCQYQKHMSQHMIGDMRTDWILQLRNAFLIRDPAEMIASYNVKREAVAAGDLGLAQQVKLYRFVAENTGSEPPVIDARDVLQDPPTTLAALCESLGIPYTDSMLHWKAGPRASDGVWAAHWYDSVLKSTGFKRYKAADTRLNRQQQRVLQDCEDDYAYLFERRLRT